METVLQSVQKKTVDGSPMELNCGRNAENALQLLLDE
jgi:hypothetical protein